VYARARVRVPSVFPLNSSTSTSSIAGNDPGERIAIRVHGRGAAPTPRSAHGQTVCMAAGCCKSGACCPRRDDRLRRCLNRQRKRSICRYSKLSDGPESSTLLTMEVQRRDERPRRGTRDHVLPANRGLATCPLCPRLPCGVHKLDLPAKTPIQPRRLTPPRTGRITPKNSEVDRRLALPCRLQRLVTYVGPSAGFQSIGEAVEPRRASRYTNHLSWNPGIRVFAGRSCLCTPHGRGSHRDRLSLGRDPRRPRLFGLRRAGSIAPVPLGAPELESPLRRIEVLRHLSLERPELVAKLEHAVVEEALGVTHVRVPVRPLDSRTTFGARHVPGLGERDPHRP
jgi:hypothetical protein